MHGRNIAWNVGFVELHANFLCSHFNMIMETVLRTKFMQRKNTFNGNCVHSDDTLFYVHYFSRLQKLLSYISFISRTLHTDCLEEFYTNWSWEKWKLRCSELLTRWKRSESVCR